MRTGARWLPWTNFAAAERDKHATRTCERVCVCCDFVRVLCAFVAHKMQKTRTACARAFVFCTVVCSGCTQAWLCYSSPQTTFCMRFVRTQVAFRLHFVHSTYACCMNMLFGRLLHEYKLRTKRAQKAFNMHAAFLCLSRFESCL